MTAPVSDGTPTMVSADTLMTMRTADIARFFDSSSGKKKNSNP